MNATPDMINAAWAAWRVRHGGKLGPGPAFIEAINAALAAAPKPNADSLAAAHKILGSHCMCYAEAWPAETCETERDALAVLLDSERPAPPHQGEPP